MPEQAAKIEAAIRKLDELDVKDLDLDVLFDGSPTGIAFVHAEGYILKVNSAFCDLVGYSSTELVRRRKYHDIVHPEDVDADTSEAERLLSGESDAYRILKRFLHKRGQSVWAQIQVSPVRSREGVFIHFVAHASHMPMSEEFYRIETTPDGSAAIRPFYPLAKLLRDNWKVVAAILTTLGGSIGSLTVKYFGMQAETSQQREVIAYQQKEIDRHKVEMDEMRRRVDRIEK